MKMCDRLIEFDNPEKIEKIDKQLDSINSFLLDNIRTGLFDDSKLESVSNKMEDHFEETCNVLSEHSGARVVKEMTTYEFYSFSKYITAKLKREKASLQKR